MQPINNYTPSEVIVQGASLCNFAGLGEDGLCFKVDNNYCKCVQPRLDLNMGQTAELLSRLQSIAVMFLNFGAGQ